MDLQDLLRNYPTLRDMALAGIGSLLAPLINFAGLLVVSLFYSPEDYALWAIFMSFALIPGTVATLRYELAIVLAESEREAGSVFCLCVLLAALVALGSWAITMGVLLALPAWEYSAGLWPWLWGVPILVFLTAFFQAVDACCTRSRAFGVRTVALIVLAGLTCAVQLGAYLAGWHGAGALIFGTLLGNAAAAAILLYALWRDAAAGFVEGITFTGLRPIAVRYRNFPLFSVPYAFVGTLRQQGVTLLFGGFASGIALGYYAFAYRLTTFPVGLFSNGIRPVLFQKAARQSSLRSLQPFLENVLYTLSALCIPGLIWLLFRADFLFASCLPGKWAGVAPYFQLLIVPAVALVHSNWMDRILDVLRLQRLAFRLEMVFALACLAALTFGLAVLDSPILGVALQAACLLIYNIYYIYVIYREAGFDYGGLWRYARDAAAFLLGTAALFVVFVAVLPRFVSDALFWCVAYAAAAAYLFVRFRHHVRQAAPGRVPRAVALPPAEPAHTAA